MHKMIRVRINGAKRAGSRLVRAALVVVCLSNSAGGKEGGALKGV